MKGVITLSLLMAMGINACFSASAIASTGTVAPKLSMAASAGASAPLKACDVHISVGNAGKVVDLQQLSTMKVADYEQLSGKKMTWFGRLEFKAGQKKLRHAISKDGTVNNEKATKLAREMDGTTGFHLGGFALGFFLLPIGVLIAYLINDGKKSNRVKWAWIGFAAGLIIGGALIL